MHFFALRVSSFNCINIIALMNRYGHPHEELLERLKRSGAEVMITKESGAITIKTDGSKMEVWDYTSSME